MYLLWIPSLAFRAKQQEIQERTSCLIVYFKIQSIKNILFNSHENPLTTKNYSLKLNKFLLYFENDVT